MNVTARCRVEDREGAAESAEEQHHHHHRLELVDGILCVQDARLDPVGGEPAAATLG